MGLSEFKKQLLNPEKEISCLPNFSVAFGGLAIRFFLLSLDFTNMQVPEW
jgi:hypothetical protein